MTDYIGSYGERDWELGSNEGRVRYIVANGLFNADASTMQNLVFSSDIYLTPTDAERVERVTGVDPEVYWSVGHALHATVSAITVDNLRERGASIRSMDYLAAAGCTEEESRSLLDLYSTECSALRENVRARYSVTDLRPYDSLPFSIHPWVRFGDHAVCPSLRLLQRKVTDGLRYLNLDHDHTTRPERDAYLTGLGHRFEAFVGDHLRHAVRADDRLFLDSDLRQFRRDHESVADAVVIAGDTVLVVEAKASSMRLDARVGENFPALEDWLRKSLVKGVQQTWLTAQWIDGPGRAQLGLDTAAPLTFVPVVVTLEELPTSPWLYSWVAEELSSEAISSSATCLAHQFLTMSEVGLLASLVSAFGRSIPQVLRLRAEDPVGARVPMMNYFLLEHPTEAAAADAGSLTRARFATLTQQLVDRLRSGGRRSDASSAEAHSSERKE